MRHQEMHITVAHLRDYDPVAWHDTCLQFDIKPLWIELNNFERQLMCGFAYTQPKMREVLQVCQANDFRILRVKHEVEVTAFEQVTCDPYGPHEAIYYECHVKLEGTFCPWLAMSSRDLYRPDRWYVTKRDPAPFDPATFAKAVGIWAIGRARVVEVEYEAAILDTHPEMDARWR